MERYYENENRRRSHKMAIEHNNVFTLEQIEDVCSLVKHGRWPDGHYGDDECLLWSLLRKHFGDF